MSDTIKIHVYRLEGCRPRPLANYLKSLGILRLVSEQADPNARGWWKDDVFHLATKLDRERLENFFLFEYQPTPILSPWLKGSGFYDPDDDGLRPIEDSKASRLQVYRDGIAQSRTLLTDVQEADAIARALKARTKTNKSFQTDGQRQFLKKSPLYKKFRQSVQFQLDEKQEEIDADPALESNESMKLEINRLKSLVDAFEFFIDHPGMDPESGDVQRPSKAEADRLKKSKTYIRILKIADAEFTRLKAMLLVDGKRVLRGPIEDWFSVVVVVTDDAEATWPALLGTGGNVGNYDCTNNLMKAIGQLIDLETGAPTSISSLLFSQCAFGETIPDMQSKIGGSQFFPTSGGLNCGTGFEGSNGVNLWDIVLMMEGTLLFQASATRKCFADALPLASAPFAVWGSNIGYGSSVDSEKDRGEQWMPLWSAASLLCEVENLFLQSKCQIGRNQSRRGTDMARSLARMGTANGVPAFERFGYLERNGQSTLAVPLGTFRALSQPNQDLLDEVAPWIDRLRRVAGGKNAPTSILRAHRACEEAMMRCTQVPTGESFLTLLETMAAAEDQFVTSPKFSDANYAQPIPRLSPAWANLIFEYGRENPSVRLAFALAAQGGPLDSNKESVSVRKHWLPLDGYRFKSGERGIAAGPDQCAAGLPLEMALLNVVHRRLLAMSRGITTGWLPLRLSDNRYGVSLSHINAFLNREVDDAEVLSIARGLMALDLRGSRKTPSDTGSTKIVQTKPEREPLGGMATFGVLKLALGGGFQEWSKSKNRPANRPVWVPNQGDIQIKCNPVIFNRLRNGDLNSAMELALRRLSIASLRPRISVAIGSDEYAKRLAASLAFGVSDSTMTRLALGLTDPQLVDRDDLPIELNV